MIVDPTAWPMWVVVAGGKSATLYRHQSPQASLEQIETIGNPESGLREQDRVSDQSGRSFDSQGSGRHRMEPKMTRKRHDEIRYAAELANAIGRGHDAREFSSLSLIAPPRLLGELRAEIKAPVRATVACEIPKDLSQASASEITERIGKGMSNSTITAL